MSLFSWVTYKNSIPNTVKSDFSAKLFIRIKDSFLISQNPRSATF